MHLFRNSPRTSALTLRRRDSSTASKAARASAFDLWLAKMLGAAARAPAAIASSSPQRSRALLMGGSRIGRGPFKARGLGV